MLSSWYCALSPCASLVVSSSMIVCRTRFFSGDKTGAVSVGCLGLVEMEAIDLDPSPAVSDGLSWISRVLLRVAVVQL